MAQVNLSLSNIELMDGGKLAADFAAVLAQAARDCTERPKIAKRREVALKVYLQPSEEVDGEVEVALEVGGKIPGFRSKPHLMHPTGYGTLQFHPDLPREPQGKMLWDAAGEGAAEPVLKAKAKATAPPAANGTVLEPEAWPVPAGLTDELLDAAFIGDKFAGRKLTKPVSVPRAFEWDGQPWVVTSVGRGHDDALHFARPLIPVREFEERYPQYPTAFQPGESSPIGADAHEARLQYYTGAVIKVGRKEYAIAPAGEGRTIVVPQPGAAESAAAPAFPAGEPEGRIDNPQLVALADLDLPREVAKKLDAAGLATVGDVRRLADPEEEFGPARLIVDRLIQLTDMRYEEAEQVDQAVGRLVLSQPRRCRRCGCTDGDCRQCIAKTGEPCHWVEEDLCSACAEPAGEKPAPKKGRKAKVEGVQP